MTGKTLLPRILEVSLLIFLLLLLPLGGISQENNVRGIVTSSEDGTPLVGARVVLEGTRKGANTSENGSFGLLVENFPATLLVSYFGHLPLQVTVPSPTTTLKIIMEPDVVKTDVVVIVGISERQQQSALSVEAMTINGIKSTPSESFYAGLGNMKGVDINGSIGFKVINTRGFNSAAPVRSLQIIDGVDNQSPGLNFSLGNFLGASELDVEQVEIIQGASSAYYGPNAFNGVISMKTKSPFVHQGLSVMLKGGERNLGEAAIRYADGFGSRGGQEVFAFKINAYYLTVNDWEADNFDEVDIADSLRVGVNNPGGYDAVNRYGDENLNPGSRNYTNRSGQITYPGLGIYHRTGYNEQDLVDYGTWNAKLGAAAHYRVSRDWELIAASNFGAGTTILQGDNRYSLRNIRFFQHRLELQRKDRGFIRAYMTHENAGDSYDAVFTGVRLQENRPRDGDWTRDYRDNYRNMIVPRVQEFEGFPRPEVIFDPVTGTVQVGYDYDLANEILGNNLDSLTKWHQEIRAIADVNYLQPGTPAFEERFQEITSSTLNEGQGTLLVDRSALFHMHGEYLFQPGWADVVVGGNIRQFRPVSEGTIFQDTLTITETMNPDGTMRFDSTRRVITNFEAGAYLGLERKLVRDRLKLNATVRVDKNQNFPMLVSPAFSAVWLLKEKSQSDILRISFSSAIRNPTLADQYLFYNVGQAILIGNLNGVENLVTPESFVNFSNGNLDTTLLERFDVGPIKPERVQSVELGYRGVLLKDKLFVDASYYFSLYRDFIGYNIGIDTRFSPGLALPTTVQAYRVSANATDIVTTQGFSIGLDYFFSDGYKVSGNYSWNILNTVTDDPIIPAFNTPEHKFNLGVHGTNITVLGMEKLGFSVNYKWVDGFLFEGSPQFTGFVPGYTMLDAQVNKEIDINRVKVVWKLGGSNLLNNRIFQVYGGPRIGRLVYLSAVFDID